MPRNRIRPFLKEVAGRGVVCSAVHEVDFRVALWRARRGVNMVTPEVAAKIEGVLDGNIGEILVAEGDYFLLRDKEGELVLSGRGDLAELDTVDFGANVGD